MVKKTNAEVKVEFEQALRDLNLPKGIPFPTRVWKNNRDSALRLTDETYFYSKAGEMESWSFDLKKFMGLPDARRAPHRTQGINRLLLDMDRKLGCPYHLDFLKEKITLYDRKIGLALGLYGSLKKYLEKIKK